MSANNQQETWLEFYENAKPVLFKEIGRVPTFEEFQKIILSNDYDLYDEATSLS